MRINIVLGDELVRKIDAVSKEQKKSRSKFIREASGRYLAEYQRLKEEEIRKKKLENAVRIQDGLREKSRNWNGVSEVRKGRERTR